MHILNADSAPLGDRGHKEAERIAKGLYDGTIKTGTIDPAMTKLVAEQLRKAVIEGFGKDFPKVSYGTADYKMLSALELNTFHFSAAENYQMLKSMSLALLDENGQLRSFKDFKTQAAKIAGVYLERNLRTEYQSAIASSQMASKWVDFEKNKDTAPWLRYDTVGDARVRAEHKKLDGIIKKVDDQFWSIWYPPNGWRCRCDVTQLLHGSETSSDQIQIPNDVPPMFQTNMAKDGLVFPDGHPYYSGLSENLKRKAAALRTPQYSQAYPIKGKTKQGGKVEISSMAAKTDLNYNIEKSTILADNGEVVKIRPHIEAEKIKNPELELYNSTQLGDFKEPIVKTRNSYEKNIRRAANQGAQIPVFVMKENTYSHELFIRAFDNNEMWKKATAITEVWIMYDKNLIKITREEIRLKSYYDKLPQ